MFFYRDLRLSGQGKDCAAVSQQGGTGRNILLDGKNGTKTVNEKCFDGKSFLEIENEVTVEVIY